MIWAIAAVGLTVILWAGRIFHIFPRKLFNTDGRNYVKLYGRLYSGRYNLWQPVAEIIPFVLYVSSKQPFYLDDYGFNRGRAPKRAGKARGARSTA